MRYFKTPLASILIVAFSPILFSSCLTGQKMDKYVAGQYNNELPKPARKKNTDITITSAAPNAGTEVSNSTHKTSKMLPLLLYWQWEYRVTTDLNSAIGVTRFSNSLNASVNRSLTEKLQGRKLELTIEQLPRSFSFVDKAHLVYLLLYAVSWDRVYMEPKADDLVVSYKVLDSANTIKSGKISVVNKAKKNGLGFFQSWKSAVREQIAEYDTNINSMTRSFIDQLIVEL